MQTTNNHFAVCVLILILCAIVHKWHLRSGDNIAHLHQHGQLELTAQPYFSYSKHGSARFTTLLDVVKVILVRSQHASGFKQAIDRTHLCLGLPLLPLLYRPPLQPSKNCCCHTLTARL